MNNNIREYHSLRLFRGRKRNNAEMQWLADSCLDFEYRRLLIEENELDLHVYFSRMTVFNWLSWGFLALAIIYLQFPIMASVFVGPALITRVLAFRCKKKFQFVFRCFKLALAIVDSVIRQNHGITFWWCSLNSIDRFISNTASVFENRWLNYNFLISKIVYKYLILL